MEKKKEELETEDFTFGDFTFTNPNPKILSHPNLPPISTKKKPDSDDDDEWGDFVKTPFGSADDNLQRVFTKPTNPEASENGSANSSSSGSKLKGPLPLSFFGDIEDDVVSEDKIFDVANVVTSKKKSGISDVISDLYTSNNDDNSNNNRESSKKKEIGGEDGFSFGFYQKGSKIEAKDSIFEGRGFGFGLGVDGGKKSGENGDGVIRSRSNVESVVSGFGFSGWGLECSEPNSAPSVGDQSKQGSVVNDQKGKNGGEVSGCVVRSRSNVEGVVSGFNFSGLGLEHTEPNSASSVGDESKLGNVVNDQKAKNGNEVNGSVNRSGSNVDENAVWGFSSSGDHKAKNSVNESVIRSSSNVEKAASGFDFSGWGLEYSEPNSAPSVADQKRQGNVVNDEFSFDPNRLVSGSNASTSNTSEFGFDFGGWGLSSNGGGTGSGVLKSSTDVNSLKENEEFRSSSKNTGLDGNDKGGNNCDEDEDDGWEFKGAFSENKGSHGVDITLNSDLHSNGGSPNKAVSLTSKSEELDGSGNNGNKHAGFNGIFLEENAGHTIDKVGPSTREPSNTSTYSTGFSNGTYDANNLFAISDGLNNSIPMGSRFSIDSSNLTQESNSLAAPITFTPDSLLRSEPSEGKAQLSSSDITIEDAETDDDFGDFTAAFSETGPNRETDSKANDLWAFGTDAVTSTSLDQVNDGQYLEQNSRLESYMPSPVIGSSHRALDLFSMSNGQTDLFSMANAIDGTSLELQTDCDSLSSNAADIRGAPTHQGNAQEGNGDELNPHSVPESGENEDDFGDFAAAFREAGQEVLKASNPSQSAREESAASGKDLGGSPAGDEKGALPLSLFGDEESEVDTNILNTYTHSHSVSQSSGPSPKSAVSINDLISNLYSQAEQSSPHKFIDATDSGAGHTIEINSETVHNDDDFNDDSWEFKGSFGNNGTCAETLSPEVAASSIPSKVRVKNYVDFYSKLQDILYFLIKCHLENIKKDGDSGKVMAVDEEIQISCGIADYDAYVEFDKDELEDHAQEAVVTKEDSFEGQATTDASLDELIEALKDPKLQILEAEYDLSIKLSSAEKDFKSALELKRHAKTMIYLLSLGSLEDHLMYVNLWSKMISICAQELQAGGKILEQSLKRNVKSELLSETQGKEFIKALGEIYRVAIVLGVSARLYKPWTLGCSGESTQMFAFLDECQSVWSTSGLEKALLDILHFESYNDEDAPPALVESIQYIHNLNVPALRDHVSNWQDSRCGLSLLTLDVIPGMKTVVWEGKTYFVKLANLWANRISCDPPRVPPLHEMVDEKAG